MSKIDLCVNYEYVVVVTCRREGASAHTSELSRVKKENIPCISPDPLDLLGRDGFRGTQGVIYRIFDEMGESDWVSTGTESGQIFPVA